MFFDILLCASWPRLPARERSCQLLQTSLEGNGKRNVVWEEESWSFLGRNMALSFCSPVDCRLQSNAWDDMEIDSHGTLVSDPGGTETEKGCVVGGGGVWVRELQAASVSVCGHEH